MVFAAFDEASADVLAEAFAPRGPPGRRRHRQPWAAPAGPCSSLTAGCPLTSPTRDPCPVTGRARLSYRRAAELFKALTRPLAHPGITDPAELEARGGWTLRQLRHSALTHEAGDGTNTPALLARSRRASVRSLERYARRSVDAAAAHVVGRDPPRR
jgi:hypothetical protein